MFLENMSVRYCLCQATATSSVHSGLVRATDDKQVEECSDIGMSHCATIKIPARALAQQTRRRPATRQLRLSTKKSE